MKGTWSIHFTSGPAGDFIDVGTVTGSVTATSVAFILRSIKGDRLNGALAFASNEATEELISGSFHFPADRSHNGPFSIQPSVAPATVYVNIGENFFSPNKLTISAGQTVRWVNRAAPNTRLIRTIHPESASRFRPSYSTHRH